MLKETSSVCLEMCDVNLPRNPGKLHCGVGITSNPDKQTALSIAILSTDDLSHCAVVLGKQLFPAG